MEGGILRRQILSALTILFALLAPCFALAERNVDSALRKASQGGDLAEMQHQLDLEAEPNQAYALFAAVQGNQLAAVKYLLAHGADPNAWTRINLRVPLGAAYSPMYVAAGQGNLEILHYLKTHGADVNAEWILDRYLSQTALGASILAGDVQGTLSLIEYGADVNHVPRGGDMPLIQTVSAAKNNVELAQLLLHHGADPDIKNASGVSVRRQSRENVELQTLIEQAKPAPAAQLTYWTWRRRCTTRRCATPRCRVTRHKWRSTIHAGESPRQAHSRSSKHCRNFASSKPTPRLLLNRPKLQPRRPAMMNFDGSWRHCTAFARCRSSTNSASAPRYPMGQLPGPGLHRL